MTALASIVALLWAHLDDIFAVLFALQAVLVLISKLTPTPKDDAIAAKILSVLESIASVLSVKRKDFPAAPTSPGLY
ncbi:hypothetical protein [Rhizobium leguminosarum]|uniref:Uncharacterized protein n=1 Tax=Rhizobium phage RHEph01 TaxID=1220601 RepID=L7TLV7_9CAUD|nr:hypothetical protein [Rhizobium leguminosarum]YP_009783938.1 hypothetical protein HOQ88_gp36 [Rhizobium phage RHEph01]AGC35547.1 hypothetical protein RHEph01_gp036 [Rhizobium phage RHEph01]MBB4345218.1 hypothetical protein [Rhizobium leguminosarum]MBB6298289.1 hypothetical protein [Rhizobium leguminosarum]